MTQAIKLLKLYTNEAAYFGDLRVFEVVTDRARQAGLAGVTVLQALTGFGRSGLVRSGHALSGDRTVVIEIIDEEPALRRFVDALGDLPDVSLITLETVEVLRSRRNEPRDA